MKTRNRYALLGLIAGSVLMWGGSVGTLTTFQANTKAKAAEVNANFSAVKTAVDGNAGDIATKQKRVTGTCAVGSAIIEIKADGTVVCDDSSKVAAPTGYNVIYAGGRAWLDRNLGATTVAASWDDTTTTARGDLYQWGRKADGHEKRDSTNSAVNSRCSTTDKPNHSEFILTTTVPFNWRTTNSNCNGNAGRNDFWSDPGNSTFNGVCPTGWRVPTKRDFEALEIANGLDAYSKIKLVAAGLRNRHDGTITNTGVYGLYWTATVNGVRSYGVGFSQTATSIFLADRAVGYSVRCVKDLRN